MRRDKKPNKAQTIEQFSILIQKNVPFMIFLLYLASLG